MYDFHPVKFEKLNKSTKLYYGVDLEKQREALLKSENVKIIVDDILKKAEKAKDKKYEVLPMSLYDTQYLGGNRRSFEYPWFERRDNCQYLAAALWLTQDEKYIYPLIDHIWMICDEFTWCSPAHLHFVAEVNTLDDIVTQLELFHCQTARFLTEIAVMVGEFLPSYIHARLEYEIRRRVIKPMVEERHFWWMDAKLNWGPVCASGVCVALLHYGTEDEIEKILPVLNQCAENYLDGVCDDGCCLEGYLYWGYGFGHFLILAQCIYEYTKGRLNYFERHKVKELSLFMQRITMGNRTMLCFSDAQPELWFSPGTISFLKKLYPEEIVRPDIKYGVGYTRNIYSLTELLWLDADYSTDERKPCETFFEQSQWYVKQTDKFCFGAKGGHNGEPHNHCDIGGFMLVVDDEIPLDDFGQGLYGAFTHEQIFSRLTEGSRGHSVPIINGTYQGYYGGDHKYRAENMKLEDNELSLDIEKAYEEGLVDKIHRTFKIGENSIILTDDFVYSEQTETIVERFVSHIEPQVGENFVDYGKARIVFDNKKYKVSVEKESYRNHYNTKDLDAYLVDFVAADDRETHFEFKIEIK